MENNKAKEIVLVCSACHEEYETNNEWSNYFYCCKQCSDNKICDD